MAFVPLFGEASNSVGIVKGTVEWEAFLHSQIASKGGASFRNPNDFHIILRIDCVCDSFPDCSKSIDCDFNAHLDTRYHQRPGAFDGRLRTYPRIHAVVKNDFCPHFTGVRVKEDSAPEGREG